MATTTTRNRSTGGPTGTRHRNGDAAPHLARLGKEVHRFGTVLDLPIELDASVRTESCEMLNGILADSLVLYALYKKHHWNVVGPTFYPRHLLFDNMPRSSSSSSTRSPSECRCWAASQLATRGMPPS